MLKYDSAQFERARLIKGWSQKRLAEKTGLSQPTVCDFLNGKNQSPETAKKLAKPLGLRMEDVIADGEKAS